MPTELHSCEGTSGLTPNIPETGGSIAGLVKRGCNEHILFSDTQTVTHRIPVMLARQNGFDFAVTAMSVEDILKISFIPSLDFEKSAQEFCDFTDATIRTGPPYRQWQRPLNKSREHKIAKYFWNPATGGRPWTRNETIIPGAVVLGCLNDTRAGTSISVHSTNFGGTIVNELRVEFQLVDICGSCARDASSPGWPGPPGKPFFTQCPYHGCLGGHKVNIQPIQIIDGQHRSNGILRNNPGDNVPVVFLLPDQEEDANPDHQNYTKPAISGTNVNIQAKVFEHVNNEAKELDKYHKIWIKAILGASSISPVAVSLFRIYANTGGVVARSPWNSEVRMHDTRMRLPLINSDQFEHLGEILLGTPGEGLNRYNGTVVPPVLPTDPTVTDQDQLERFLQSALTVLAPLYTGTSPPFKRHVRTEALLERYDDLVRHVRALDPTLGLAGYEDMWRLQSANLSSPSQWSGFTTGAEDAPTLFRKFMLHMWRPTGGVWGTVDSGHTYLDNTGATVTTSWQDLAGSVPHSSPFTAALDPVVSNQINYTFTPPFNAYNQSVISVTIRNPGTSDEEHAEITSLTSPGDFNLTNHFAPTMLVTGNTVEVKIKHQNQNGLCYESAPAITL